MPDIGPITDSYIDGIIKANAASNPGATTTLGVDLRVLVKLLRDRLEQEIAAETTNRTNADVTLLADAQTYTDTTLADQRKNYFRSMSVNRGTPYANEVVIYFPNAGSIASIAGVNISNTFYKTTPGGTYAALSFPIAIAAGGSLYLKFDFTDTTNLNGNIAITGRDN